MIQRIQSIYILVAAVLLVLLYCSPFAEVDCGNLCVGITAFHLSPSVEGLSKAAMVPLALVVSLTIVLCLIALFTFKNRQRQMQLTKICIYMQIVVFASMAAYVVAVSRAIGINKWSINMDLTTILPVINIVLLVMAYRGIKKDDDLVKSADRLR